MCGGTLEIAPCSHVGHIFRKSTPYSFPGGTSRIVNHNNARLAEVWLDDWKEFYFSINPGVRLGGELGGGAGGGSARRLRAPLPGVRWRIRQLQLTEELADLRAAAQCRR